MALSQTLWLILFSIGLIASICETVVGDIPGCDYHDTVNLTESARYANGSYMYEGVLIPTDLVAIYDYELLYEGERIIVPPHPRGCVCKLKSCIRFCCHPRATILEDTRECTRELESELNYTPFVKITLNNGTTTHLHVINEFAVQQSMPCEYSYPLLPEQDPEDGWQLFENGTLLRFYDMVYLPKGDYCMHPVLVDDNETYVLNPHLCPMYNDPTEGQRINSIAMIISIPFFVLTIITYLFLPELRNLHGKCLICYLSMLTLAYSLMVAVYHGIYTKIPCFIIGFTTYFAIIAAFFWLSVISFDLWNTFSRRLTIKNRFFVYSLYAWGAAILLTGLMAVARFSELNYALAPGINETYCMVKVDDWSAMIYLYAPSLILILFNITMFFLTARNIYLVKKEINRFQEPTEGTRRQRVLDRETFVQFLRLFTIMGVTWLIEFFSYLIGQRDGWSKIFLVLDLCNAAQGIIIFGLFVLKKKVLHLIKKRLWGKRKTENSDSLDDSQEEISLQEKTGVISILD